MDIQTAINGAIKTAIDQGIANGFLNPNNKSYQDAVEYLLENVPPNLDWPPRLVESCINSAAEHWYYAQQ